MGGKRTPYYRSRCKALKLPSYTVAGTTANVQVLKQAAGSWKSLPRQVPRAIRKAAQDAAARLTQGIGCSDAEAHNQLIKWAEATDINLVEDMDSLAGRNHFTAFAPHSWSYITNIKAALRDFTTFMDAMGRGHDNPFREQVQELNAWLKQQNDQLRSKYESGACPYVGMPNALERTTDGGALCPPSSITTTLLSVVVLWPVLLECLQQLADPMVQSTPSTAVTAMYAAQFLLAAVYLSYMGGRVKDAEQLKDTDDICVIGPDNKRWPLQAALMKVPGLDFSPILEVLRLGAGCVIEKYHSKTAANIPARECIYTMLPQGLNGMCVINTLLALWKTQSLAWPHLDEQRLRPGLLLGFYKGDTSDLCAKLAAWHKNTKLWRGVDPQLMEVMTQLTGYCARYGIAVDFGVYGGNMLLLAMIMGHRDVVTQERYKTQGAAIEFYADPDKAPEIIGGASQAPREPVPDGSSSNTSSSATIKPVDQSKRSFAWGEQHPSDPCAAQNLVLVKTAEYSFATFTARVEHMDPARQQWLISQLAPIYGPDKPLADLLLAACSDQKYHLNGGQRPACSSADAPAWSAFPGKGFEGARALKKELCELPEKVRQLEQAMTDAQTEASAARLDGALQELGDAWNHVAQRAGLRFFFEVVAVAQHPHTTASAVREYGVQCWLDVRHLSWPPPLLPPQLVGPPGLILDRKTEDAIVEIVKAALAMVDREGSLNSLPPQESGAFRVAINKLCDKHAARTAALARKEEAARRLGEVKDRLRWVRETLPTRYMELPRISIAGFERRKDVHLALDVQEIDGYKPSTPDAFARHFADGEAKLERLQEPRQQPPSPPGSEQQQQQRRRHFFEDEPYGLAYRTKATQLIQLALGVYRPFLADKLEAWHVHHVWVPENDVRQELQPLISPIIRWSAPGRTFPDVTLLTTHNFRYEFAHKSNYDALVNNLFLIAKRSGNIAAVVRAGAALLDLDETQADAGNSHYDYGRSSSSSSDDDPMSDDLYTPALAGDAGQRAQSARQPQQVHTLQLQQRMLALPRTGPSPPPPPPTPQQQQQPMPAPPRTDPPPPPPPDDDVPCEICRRKKSVASNEMLLCDGIREGATCNKGYHMRCLGLESVPDGRWHGPCCADHGRPPPKRTKKTAKTSAAAAGAAGAAGTPAAPAAAAAPAAGASSSTTAVEVGNELLVMILAEGSQHLFHARVASSEDGSNVVKLDLLHPCAKHTPGTNETRKRMRLMAAPHGVAFEVAAQRDDGTPCKPPPANTWRKDANWMRITDGQCKYCGDAERWRNALEQQQQG